MKDIKKLSSALNDIDERLIEEAAQGGRARSVPGWVKYGAVIAGGAEVRFVRGRLRFVGAEHPAPFPSAVVIFRPPPSPSQQKETNDENNDPQ